jgi:hypothetical protein
VWLACRPEADKIFLDADASGVHVTANPTQIWARFAQKLTCLTCVCGRALGLVIGRGGLRRT